MSRELFNNFRRFEQFNTEKIKRACSISPINGQIAFQVIPFLVHTNSKGFPGYFDVTEPPCGINAYKWSEEIKKAINEYFPNHKVLDMTMNRLFRPNSSIESLLLMGSIGSIAQNEKSDFDYWVCFDGTKMNQKNLTLLKNKLTLIEEWAQVYDMEVHFFPTDIHKVRKNDFGDINKESAGTAQGKILKEEFYRTLIHVSGKIPLWWITPPGISNENYEQYKENLLYSVELEPNNFIDIGNVTKISYDEYFGAALWQMNKALESPYKSVLKMALLEGFMDPKGSQELLCETLKKNVFNAPNGSIKQLDSYRIMFDRILNYYSTKERRDVVDLLRRCFYIKVGEKVSHFGTKVAQWAIKVDGYKGPVMRHYLREWGWEDKTYDDLNNYSRWGFDKMLTLGDEMHNFLLQTYKNLMDHLKKKSALETKISDNDLTILGRKLFSFYSKKPNKVIPLKNPFDKRLCLDRLSFSVSMENKRRSVWSVYRGQIYKNKLEDSADLFLKKGTHLTELIVWIVFNRLCDEKTSLYLIPSSIPVSLKEIQRLIKELTFFFPQVSIASIANEALLSDPRKTKIFAVLNFASHHWIDKVEEVTLVYITSWGELFCKTYKGMEGIQAFIRYIEESPPANRENLSGYYNIFIPGESQLSDTKKKINDIILKQLGLS